MDLRAAARVAAWIDGGGGTRGIGASRAAKVLEGDARRKLLPVERRLHREATRAVERRDALDGVPIDARGGHDHGAKAAPVVVTEPKIGPCESDLRATDDGARGGHHIADLCGVYTAHAQRVHVDLLAVERDLQARLCWPHVTSTLELPVEQVHVVDAPEVLALALAVRAKPDRPSGRGRPARQRDAVEVGLAVDECVEPVAVISHLEHLGLIPLDGLQETCVATRRGESSARK